MPSAHCPPGKNGPSLRHRKLLILSAAKPRETPRSRCQGPGAAGRRASPGQISLPGTLTLNQERELLSPSLSYRVVAKSVLKILAKKSRRFPRITQHSKRRTNFFFSRGNSIANPDLSPIWFLHDKILIFIRTPSPSSSPSFTQFLITNRTKSKNYESQFSKHIYFFDI